jgi:hypothetical protein
MNGIDPKIGISLNIVYLLGLAIAGGSIAFAGLSVATVDAIKVYALDVSVAVGMVNSVLHLYSSATPGPMVTPPK